VPLIQREDLPHRRNSQRIGGQYVLADSGAVKPVAGQAAVLVFADHGTRQKEVYRPVGELMGAGQSLMMILAVSVREVVAHAFHRV
jgi:hypothetical protein